jgi:hypothetical protein
VNERCWLRASTVAQVFVAGLKVETSVVVNGLDGRNGFPPPTVQSRPCATALPATFFAIGMFARACHVLVAML